MCSSTRILDTTGREAARVRAHTRLTMKVHTPKTPKLEPTTTKTTDRRRLPIKTGIKAGPTIGMA